MNFTLIFVDFLTLMFDDEADHPRDFTYDSIMDSTLMDFSCDFYF